MSLTRLAIRRPVTVSMCIVAVALFGLVSLDRLALNLLPDISYPSLTVQTDYEDAAPEEIESLITRPIEEVVGVANGLTRLSSTSRPGQSEVILEFDWDTNMDLASMDVREKLDLLDLPEDVDKPVILRFDPSFDPILRLQLYGDMSLARLRSIAEEEMKKRLEAVEGVAAVKVAGGREEQIRIEIDEKRLAELNIPITDVTRILGQENLNQASGSLYDLDANYLVRMLNEFRTVEEIRAIVVRSRDGKQTTLGDIAEVWRGEKERGVITRYNGEESVEVAIYKEGDANTVTVAEATLARLGRLKNESTFPRGVDWEVVFNQADFISQSVNNVLSAAIGGGVLAIIVLFVFLRDLRSTVIIGLSIPISILATFAAMFQTGITLNIMSLGGVALGVGMLVDNSIVVLEAVDRYKRDAGRLADRVAKGANEVGMAVTASTLTTVAVFLPLVFVEGVAGQLFTDQALTITYSLLASLLVALSFIPMALSVKLEPPPPEPTQTGAASGAAPTKGSGPLRTIGAGARFLLITVPRVVLRDLRWLLGRIGGGVMWVLRPGLDRFDRAFNALTERYPPLLSSALDNKGAVFAIALALAAGAWAASRGLGGELIPSLTQGEFSFEIELVEGAPLERTDAVIERLETQVREYPEVGSVFSSVGGSQQNQFSTAAIEENFGRLSVVMRDKRDVEAEEAVIERMRGLLDDYPEVSYAFTRPTLFSFKTPIEVEIFAFALEDQRQAAERIAARLAAIEGLDDIQTTTRLGNPEIQIRFDRQRMARLNLQEDQVARLLRNKIRGDVASRYREGDRQIDILVRAGERDRNAIADIRNLVVNGSGNLSGAGVMGGGGGAGENENQSLNTAGQGGSANRGNQNASGGARLGGAAERNPKPIRLDQVADIEIARGPSEIRRVRSQRAAAVTANVTGRDLTSVSSEIRAALAEIRGELPVATTVELGGQNTELETSYRSLMFALALAVFLVYLVMASQFESLTNPFIILFTVPLAMIGVVFALVLTGTTVSVVVLLGVIILAGIVVNNAIVLVDYANQLRRDGYAKREALLQAGRVRLRPIVMTTLTTVLGLAPMAFGWGEGAEIRAPMAIAVMGGLTFSTLLTLVLIPVVYELTDNKEYEADREAGERRPSAPPEEGAWQGAD